MQHIVTIGNYVVKGADVKFVEKLIAIKNLFIPVLENFMNQPEIQKLNSEDIIGIIKSKHNLINGIMNFEIGRAFQKEANPDLDYLEFTVDTVTKLLSGTDLYEKGGLNAAQIDKYL